MPHQILEHRILLGRQLDRISVSLHFPGVEVETQIRDFERRRHTRPRPARQSFDPRQQLLEREGFGDVIVGAGAQRFHLRIDGVLCGENQHRAVEPARPQIVQHLRPGFARESHVEDDDVVLLRNRARFTIIAVGDEVDAPALLLEAALDELSYCGIVFDDEDLHSTRLLMNAKGGHRCPPFESNICAARASTNRHQVPASCAHEPGWTWSLYEGCLASAAS